jgi:hypothetical protein
MEKTYYALKHNGVAFMKCETLKEAQTEAKKYIADNEIQEEIQIFFIREEHLITIKK